MTVLKLIPVILAFAVLAAHFYGAAALVPMIAALVPVGVVFVPRPWAARTIQGALAVGALEWLRVAAVLVAQRYNAGAPYVRLALNLGGVAGLTALCLLVFRAPEVRRRYALDVPR